MQYIFLAVLVTFLSAVSASAEDLSSRIEAMLNLDMLMQKAEADRLIAGGVVCIGNRDGILFEKAYGRMSYAADASPMTVDSVFDVASLTKVIATAPAVMKLAEEGRLSLVDPVAKWFPEFAREEWKDLTVYNLLTHTSGLDDISCGLGEPVYEFIARAAAQKPKGEIGSRFKYADINFILLGELVGRASGSTLDSYCLQRIYIPAGMKDTGFRPADSLRVRCTPTLVDEGTLLVGEVQDMNARRLNGVAGHAGLFSTSGDLSLFCRMILNAGELGGKRIFASRTVEQMTAPYFSRGGKVVRGLGWDILSPYSSPRGEGASEGSFGHTGYSGTSIWIDPDRDMFVIFLTSRLDYRRTSDFNRLRGGISTLAGKLARAAGGPVWSASKAPPRG